MTALSGIDWPALSGMMFLAVAHDGAEGEVTPELAADGSFAYLVPEGVAEVAGWTHVMPGDTVWGKFEIGGN